MSITTRSLSSLAITAASVAVIATVLALFATTSSNRASAEAVPMNTYLGTTHIHTGLNNDHGTDTSTASDIFSTAKSNGFDFVMLTEHSGPTGPVDQVGYYADAQTQALNYSEIGRFVGLAGYEYSENSNDGDSDTGHMIGFGTTDFVNAAAPGMKFSSFFEKLVADSSQRTTFAGYNHPAATGHKGSASYLKTTANRARIVMSETSNKVTYNATNEANYYNAYIVHLDRGWRVAPTCGLDTHSMTYLKTLESATKKPCRTGLLATSLTTENVLEAMMNRRLYSTRDTNLQLRYQVNDVWMGSIVSTPTTANITVTVTDPNTTQPLDKITKIEVIGSNGQVLASQAFDAHSVTWSPTVNVGTNKYMFIRVFNGERIAHTAVSAPVWFE